MKTLPTFFHKTFLAALSLCAFTLTALSQEVKVERVHQCGPYHIQQPVLIDSVDAAQKRYSSKMLFETHIESSKLWKSPIIELASAPTSADSTQTELYLAGFEFQTAGFSKVEVSVKGPQQYKVYVNGKEAQSEQSYQPGRYQVMVKYVADTAALRIELKTKESDKVALCTMEEGGKRPFSLDDNMEMRHYAGISVSSEGRYARISKSWLQPDGKSHYESEVIELSTGRQISLRDYHGWLSKGDRYLSLRKEDGKRKLYVGDPSNNTFELLCADLPEGSIQMSPTEDYLIISQEVKGPEKEKGVYEILVPDDRQPGFRDRSQLMKLDLTTGVLQPLTFGHKNVWMYDLSQDGRYMIFGVTNERLTQRPTTLTTVCRMDLQTLQVDTLVAGDGFISNVQYIPGRSELLITGGAEAFDRIGCTLSNDLIPNEFEHQLFLFDIDNKKVQPLTKDFNPSIKSVYLSQVGQCFFTAENKDHIDLFQLDLQSYAISRIEQPCEVVGSCAISDNGKVMLYYGTGACTSDRLYQLTLGKKNKSEVTEIGDLNADRMSEIALGTCEEYEFTSSKGYPISGHYYLPANFDASQKYPVIVHYYGGCSPTSRRFGGGSHYPAHYWNANGYIVLIVNPGGASGFGQEWGARHVNTMGEGIAEDIIEATEWFAQNSWVDKAHIGCVSASYGGFMTQLLLTKTDLFATGISHAGISDHTSYWGEGYWGYSYSEVSAANSYPWTRKDLYVDRSPLYNADKIHKPLLFTHGSVDTNVPIGESIQMYTALKLLGVPTAFVVVEGENHGIMDYSKRKQWINTMVAWFDRWLKEDPTWWNAIYTPKDL